MTPLIAVHDIEKVFEESEGRTLVALKKVTLEIFENEFLVLLGPSGCGKSTLLRIMSGLEKNYRGRVERREDFSPAQVGFVFQSFALFPWLSVYENVALPLRARGVAEKEIRTRVDRELQRFGLDAFANVSPHELSGGMKQRAGMARALVVRPTVIFMDEPFSELDSFTANSLRKELLMIWKEQRTTIVMVTHLIAEAVELGDRIAVLTTRPGTIETIFTNPLPRPRAMRSPEAFVLEDKLAQVITP